MALLSRVSPSARVVFVAAFLAALGFAFFTNHVWEDYYITYRSSKNLATGQGLVFNPGDRLHTFTSPLGVLLPALCSLATLNTSDTAALWLFRLISITAFAAAVALLSTTSRRSHQSALAAAFVAFALLIDAKSIDFTINGMETGLLLFFLAWTFRCSVLPCERRSLQLGLAWAGLMWTRPDSFIYIALLSLGVVLFNRAETSGLTRAAVLKLFVFAGLICTAIYLPWFVGSWLYYGSPIPHTIVAKSVFDAPDQSWFEPLRVLVTLPIRIVSGESSVPAAFLPAYHFFGGWPAPLLPIAKLLGLLAAFLWLVPKIDFPTRTASFVFCGFHVYLTAYPYFPFPWYLPGTTLFACFALGGFLACTLRAATASALTRSVRPVVLASAAALLVLTTWTTTAVARQLAAQQDLIEDGNRRKIGEWLRTHAAPHDTVFLEPLGYIGFFSQLKTYDFPGMSSRESVAAIRRSGADWMDLIDDLAPTWLVLRPHEVERISRKAPSFLTGRYRQVADFDVSPALQELNLRGRPYLEFDSHFIVFRNDPPQRFDFPGGEAFSPFPVSTAHISGQAVQLVHAPSHVVIDIPPSARRVTLRYGFTDAAHEGSPTTDGAVFTVLWSDGRDQITLLRRPLDPSGQPADRGLHTLSADLPVSNRPGQLILKASTGPNGAKDWTCWSAPEFR